MSVKYSGLPDIDLSSNEVYETPDPVQLSASAAVIEQENEDINQGSTSLAQAKDKFATKEVYTEDDIDFSPSIGVIDKSSYKTRSVSETLEMRIIRLKREVAEVQAEMERDPIQPKIAKDDVATLEDILKKLGVRNSDPSSAVQLYNKLGEQPTGDSTKPDNGDQEKDSSSAASAAVLKNPKSSGTTTEATTSVVQKYIERIAQLESRLSALESKLGPDASLSSTPSPKPILVTVDDIRRKISLFSNDPKAIQKTTNNLKELTTLIDTLKSQISGPRQLTTTASLSSVNNAISNIISPNASTPTLTSELKISALYSKVAIIDSYGSIIPRILARLQSLQGIHTDASNSLARLKDIDNTISLMHTEISQWRQSIVSLETKLAQFDAQSAENRAQVQKWLSSLEEKS
ncbi:hypothetical protein AWJ20_2441 [Sugiyamaella lignohabitans]|uniref:Dynamitin n=1 Tax=Sugiyamaella lignohabitans TaxID=796027 RepID=A0A167F4T6_9ASCO|nr:uncharacterized protein AWJ20_2441 [Sugiyamaella lignohabitans]ANB14828.1 hypothetical protein AWJ20_2441 [Sugiyamaella lignohabitans]